MQTADLTLKQLLAMKPYEHDNEKLIKIRTDLSRNAPLTHGRDQDPTVAYALKLLESVILFNHAIKTFIQNHMIQLAYIFNSARSTLTKLIRTTTDNEIMSIDLEKINITNDKAKLAALAICHLITLHNTPEPFKDQRLTDKINAIKTKIIQYELISRSRREQLMALENDSDTSRESLAHDRLTSDGSVSAASVASVTVSTDERDVLYVQAAPADGSFLRFAEPNELPSVLTEEHVKNIPHVPRALLKMRTQPSQLVVANGFKANSQPVAREPQDSLECIAEILRCFFYLLDVVLTALLWIATGGYLGKKTMNDTHNPLAKALTGRDHFFVRSLTSLTTEANGLETSILYHNKAERDLCFLAKI